MKPQMNADGRRWGRITLFSSAFICIAAESGSAHLRFLPLQPIATATVPSREEGEPRFGASGSERQRRGPFPGVAMALAPGVHPRFARAPGPPPEAEKITDHVYRVGGAVLDMKARTVTCEGQVNMRRGMIEYLAVPPDGKRHESVLVLDVTPVHLQVALLLMGLEPGGGLRYQGDSQPPRGTAVEVRVRWKSRSGGEGTRERGNETESGGGRVRMREVRLEDLAWNIPRRRPMEAHPWIFTGLRSIDAGGGRPSAPPPRSLVPSFPRSLAPSPSPGERSLIASFRDPDAVLNNPLPAGADDTVYKANERLLPAVGTPVTVTIRESEARQP